MKILKLQYHVYIKESMLLINNEISNQLVCAMNLNSLDVSEIEKILYKGIENDQDERKSEEEKCVVKISEKFPDMFYTAETIKDIEVIEFIRYHMMTLKDSFITKNHYKKIENLVELIKESTSNLKGLVVYENERLEFLRKSLNEVPIIKFNFVEKNTLEQLSIEEYDFIVIEDSNLSELERMENLKAVIIPVGIYKEKIAVGPMVYSEKFEIPEIPFHGEKMYTSGEGDEALIFFFIQRILFITAFELYNEINKDIQLPIRNRLVINKLGLRGISQHILLTPR